MTRLPLPVLRDLRLWVATLLLAVLLLPSAAQAQGYAPLNPWASYAAWVNKYRPANPYPDRHLEIDKGRSSSLPAYYDTFWIAVLFTEASGTHWQGSTGIPLPGRADAKRYGNKVISIGISQARYGDGNIYDEAKPYSPFIKGQPWNFQRYLWDPTYNAAISYGYYSARMRENNNNPCLAYVGYNAGPSYPKTYAAHGYKVFDARSRDVHAHVANFVNWSKRKAGANAAEIDKVLQTSPGCTGAMEDVKPLAPTPEVVADRAEINIPGYCDPVAAERLRKRFEANQKDLEDTLEPLMRKIKEEAVASNSGGSTTNSTSTTSTTSGGSTSGSSSGSTMGSGGIMGSSGNSSSTSQGMSCVAVAWPNIRIQAPPMDQLVKQAEKAVVSRACAEIRKKVSEEISPLKGSFYFNPGISGVPSAGVDVTGGSP